MKLFEELESRGLIKQTNNRDKLRHLLNETSVTFYIGFDPTAESLHVGHLLQLVTAKRLLEAGHHAIILLGGATAMVGDPSGKSEMRQMLSRPAIRVNSEGIINQIDNLLVHHQQISIHNNLEWFDGKHFLDLLVEIGPHFSVNNMLRADCFKSRMEQGLSFLEFNYMIMQAFDFLHLHENANCLLQIGGDDQWSNMLAGIDLIRRKAKSEQTNSEAVALTLPLLLNSDGTKMGKTEKGAVWLDPDKTSPFDFFQFWRNIPDDQVEKCFNFFTDLSWNRAQNLHINEKKKLLAVHITTLVHGQNAAQQALEQAQALFEKQDTSTLESTSIVEGSHILDLVVKCGFAKSRTDARNLINNKGITINDKVVDNPTLLITRDTFGNDFTIRKGKKNFCRFIIKEST